MRKKSAERLQRQLEPRMTPRQIRAALILAGVKVQDIANELGITQPTVSQVIIGTRHTERTRIAIAKAIGMPVAAVFGQQPTPRRRRRDYGK